MGTRTNNSNQQETERDRKLNPERWRFYSIPFLILTTLSSDTLLHLLLADQRGSSACQEAWRRGFRGRKWHVQSSVAIKGEGLYEGLDWLCGTLRGMKTGVPTKT